MLSLSNGIIACNEALQAVRGLPDVGQRSGGGEVAPIVRENPAGAWRKCLMRMRWGDSRWSAATVLVLGLLLLVWLYPLAHLDMAGRGQGEICEDLYGRPTGVRGAGPAARAGGLD